MNEHIPTRVWLPLLLAGMIGCAAPVPESPSEVVAVMHDTLPLEPDDTAWQDAPVHRAELLLQDLVEPRLLEVSTPRIEVQAITDGLQVAFRLSWRDGSRDDLPGASRFSDGVAIQLPLQTAPDVPDPQMGERDRGVEITYWRASWQASVDGREDVIRSLYPDATVDHYPFEAPSLEPGSDRQRELAMQYAPARALGNAMEGPRDRPVQDLLAYGPGTLEPAPRQRSSGTGRRDRDDAGWSVVILRSLPDGLGGPARGQVAFAVWDGARSEVGARKMRSGWIPFHVESRG